MRNAAISSLQPSATRMPQVIINTPTLSSLDAALHVNPDADDLAPRRPRTLCNTARAASGWPLSARLLGLSGRRTPATSSMRAGTPAPASEMRHLRGKVFNRVQESYPRVAAWCQLDAVGD